MDKQLEKIMMPVNKVPIEDLLPGYTTPSGKNHAIVVDTPNGPHLANLCSEDYGLISNKELILPLLESLDNAKLKYKLAVRNFNNTRFHVAIQFPDFSNNFGTGKKPDEVIPKIDWFNSYDLSMKYNLSAGIWRLICSNGMMAPDQDSFKSLKKLHTTSFSEVSLENTVELIQEYLSDSKIILQPFEVLKERRVNEAELQEYIEDIGEFVKFPKRQNEKVLQRIIEEKATTGALDGWMVYCGFNYQLNHNEEINLAPNKLHKMDMEIVDYIAWG